MSQEFGDDFISITDEDGKEYELEVLAELEYEGSRYLALVPAGTDEAVAAGFDAGAIIKAMGPAIQGGGGGKPTMAQAGGKNPDGIDEALEIARNMIL